jgi:hypothetical protein
MRAAFEFDLSENKRDPHSIREANYFAIVNSVTRNDRYIAIVNTESAILIDQNGEMYSTAREYFEVDYYIIELPKEINLTFRNELE